MAYRHCLTVSIIHKKRNSAKQKTAVFQAAFGQIAFTLGRAKTKQGAYSAPCTPEPGDFASWTSIAETACEKKSAWFPLKPGRTRKSGMAPLCFWPGVEAANPDAKHPGKAREESAGESLLSPSDFPGLSWARSPQTFRNPSVSGERCRFSYQRNFASCGSRVLRTLAQVWGRAAPSVSFSLALIFILEDKFVTPSRRPG